MSRHELMRLEPAKATLWDRLTRSLRLGPFNTKDPALASLFGGGPTGSGVSVNEFSAMTSSPVWSGVTMIADDIASLPLFLYKRLPTGGKDRYEAHPLYELLHDTPNPEMDSMVWRRTMQMHLLLWQNAYAEIERDGAGRPKYLWPLMPERVVPFRTEAGTLVYRVTNPNGRDVVIPAEDMIHLVGYSHDGSVGSSLVQQARESIALGLAAERFGASFFGNGATFGGVISYEGGKPPEQTQKTTREALNARHQGVERAYKLLALYNGAKYTETGVTPNEGQFTETRVFQIREVARWLKMPPHKLGDLADATYSNVEQMDAAYMSSCIRPWLRLWEQQLSRKLISKLERRQQFIEHDTHGFLSVHEAAPTELYTAVFSVGSIRPNDIRGYENRDPIPGGDDAFLQIQNIPLGMMRQYWELKFEREKAEIAKLKEPTPVPVAPPPPQNDDDARALRAAVEDALERARRAEQRAEDLSAAQAEAEAARDEAKAEQAHTLELYAGATTALSAEQAERAREAREAAALADDLRAQIGDLDAILAQRDATLAQQAGALVKADEARQALEDERDALKADVEREQANIRTAAADFATRLEQAGADLTRATSHRDEAVRLQHEAEGLAAAAAEACEAAKREEVIAQQALDAANELVTVIKQREAKRMEAVITAHRALMVDAMKRLVIRETDRARRHQATPQKLRAWAETFYPEHVETVAEVLRPILLAQLAWMQTERDVDAEARSMAEAHVEESQQQLRSVLAVEDYHVSLDKLLARWEMRRPEAVADRFVQEGVAYVRSLH